MALGAGAAGASAAVQLCDTSGRFGAAVDGGNSGV